MATCSLSSAGQKSSIVSVLASGLFGVGEPPSVGPAEFGSGSFILGEALPTSVSGGAARLGM